MKQVITISATVAILYVLQSLPAYRLLDFALPFKVIRTQADIACIFCIYLGVREKSILRGTILAFIVGLFANTFSPSSMRLYALLAPLCFLVTYILNIRLFFKRIETYILLVFSLSLLYNHLFFYMMQLVSNWSVGMEQLLWPSVRQALMNALFGAIIFTFFDWVKESVQHADKTELRL